MYLFLPFFHVRLRPFFVLDKYVFVAVLPSRPYSFAQHLSNPRRTQSKRKMTCLAVSFLKMELFVQKNSSLFLVFACFPARSERARIELDLDEKTNFPQKLIVKYVSFALHQVVFLVCFLAHVLSRSFFLVLLIWEAWQIRNKLKIINVSNQKGAKMSKI